MKQSLLKKTLLLLCALVVSSGSVWADTTYKLQKVTSVSAGNLYVFEQGGHVMNNSISSSALQTTTSYKTSGLTGTESYVWTLENETGGFSIKNVKLTTNRYIKNASSTNISLTDDAPSIWVFNFQNDETVLIQNKSNSDRFLGYTSTTSYAYKAYATSNLSSSSYPHAIVVYQLVEDNGGNNPSITADDVNIDYDATNGSIGFTLNNATGNVTAEVTAGNEGNWLTLGTITASAVPFTCSANNGVTARTATVTLSFTGATSKEVTVTQARIPYSTIPDLYAAATSTATDVKVTFNDWVVSGISTNGKNVYVTDGTNGLIIFSSSDQSSTYSVGDILSGTAVDCKVQLYGGAAEITDLDATDLTIYDGGTVSPANIALNALTGLNTGALVSYSGLTCSVNNNKYYLSDGTTTLQMYNNIYDFDTTFEEGKLYNITGIYLQYNSTKELMPRSTSDIEKVLDPSITLSTSSIDVTCDGADGTIDVTYHNIASVDAEVLFVESDGTTAATYDWMDAEIKSSDNTKLDYVIGENTGAARSAYMKVHQKGTNAYSELITITQAAYVAPTIFKKITSADDLAAGDEFLIVYEGNGNTQPAQAATTVSSQIFGCTDVTINSSNEISVAPSSAATVFVLGGKAGAWTLYSNAENAYVYATAAKKIGTKQTDEGAWTIAYDNGDLTLSSVTDNYGDLQYNYNSGNSRFTTYTSNQEAIHLYRKVVDRTHVTVGASGYTTYVTKKNVSFPSGVSAFIATGVSASSITLQEMLKVPANTALIIQADADDYELTEESIDDCENVSSNKLLGSNGIKKGDGSTIYALGNKSGIGFYKVANNNVIPSGKAYLVDTGTNPVKGFFDFNFNDDTPTGVEEVSGFKIQVSSDAQLFNLAGQRVNKATKGIFIVNGKKVVR